MLLVIRIYIVQYDTINNLYVTPSFTKLHVYKQNRTNVNTFISSNVLKQMFIFFNHFSPHNHKRWFNIFRLVYVYAIIIYETDIHLCLLRHTCKSIIWIQLKRWNDSSNYLTGGKVQLNVHRKPWIRWLTWTFTNVSFMSD